MCVRACVAGLAVDLQVVGLETHRVLVTWWLVAVLLWSVCSFRMTDAGDVANDGPLSLIVWWRPDQDRRPLRWALQAHLSTSCTRRHIIEVRMKLSSQRRCIPVGPRLRHCQRALLYACWQLECPFAG